MRSVGFRPAADGVIGRAVGAGGPVPETRSGGLRAIRRPLEFPERGLPILDRLPALTPIPDRTGSGPATAATPNPARVPAASTRRSGGRPAREQGDGQ